MRMNRVNRELVLVAVTAGSCEGFTPYNTNSGDGGACVTGDMRSTPADLAVPAAKCAAAAGLAGTNLLCVDFDKVTQLTDPALTGWKFDANMAGCWQISGGYLQVQNFGTFVGNCGLTAYSFRIASSKSSASQ